MTYAQYVLECQRRQRDYIRTETRRMEKAAKLHRAYTAKMAALNLHPLTALEIHDRQRQLETMMRNVPETHGDSPAMRGAFEMRESIA